MTWLVLVPVVIVVGVAGLLAIAEYRWRARTSAALSRLAGDAPRPAVYSRRAPESPGAGRLAFQPSAPGQPTCARPPDPARHAVRPPGWQTFVATEHFVTLRWVPLGRAHRRRRGVKVRDSFIEEPALLGMLLGLFPVIAVEGTPTSPPAPCTLPAEVPGCPALLLSQGRCGASTFDAWPRSQSEARRCGWIPLPRTVPSPVSTICAR
jgi:hypothetical protein